MLTNQNLEVMNKNNFLVQSCMSAGAINLRRGDETAGSVNSSSETNSENSIDLETDSLSSKQEEMSLDWWLLV